MKKIIVFLDNLFKNISTAIQRRPGECLLLLYLTIVLLIDVWKDGLTIVNSASTWFFLFMPTMLIFNILREKLNNKKLHSFYFSSIVLCFGLIIYSLFDNHIVTYINSSSSIGIKYYCACFLLSIISLVIHSWSTDDTITSRCYYYFVSFIKALIISVIIFLLDLCLASLIKGLLYDYPSYSKIIGCLAIICFVFILPLITLAYADDRNETAEIFNKFISTIINYVLSIAIIIYIGILYIYILKILILMDLPRGGVAGIVLGLSILIILSYHCHNILKQKEFQWFFNRLGLFFIPILILFWIGATRRICDYGWTDIRVYMVLSGISLTVWTVYQIIKSQSALKRSIVTFISLLALFTFIPGITAQDIETWSQADRPQQDDSNATTDDSHPSYSLLRESDIINIQKYSEIEIYPTSFSGDTIGEWRVITPNVMFTITSEMVQTSIERNMAMSLDSLYQYLDSNNENTMDIERNKLIISINDSTDILIDNVSFNPYQSQKIEDFSCEMILYK